jgi:hypothetical protein
LKNPDETDYYFTVTINAMQSLEMCKMLHNKLKPNIGIAVNILIFWSQIHLISTHAIQTTKAMTEEGFGAQG